MNVLHNRDIKNMFKDNYILTIYTTDFQNLNNMIFQIKDKITDMKYNFLKIK